MMLSTTTRAAVRQGRGGLATLPSSFLRSSKWPVMKTNPTFAVANYSSIEGPFPPVLPKPDESNIPQSLNERQSKKGLFGRLMNRYSLQGQQSRIHRAETLFQAATRQANDPMWYGPGHIARDFRPRHAMLTMHIWFLHKRLIADQVDPETALMVQEEMFNILWDDTTCRIRQQGVNELAVNKHLMQVQQYTFLHLTHYDHAYTEYLDKPIQRMKELRKIIWQHIMVRDEQYENCTDLLDRIAWYIDANYRNIMMDWPDELYRQAAVGWVNLPDFSDMKDAEGNPLPENPIHPDDVLPEPWLKNITLRGIEYYWNPVTRQSTWNREDIGK